MNSPPKFTKDVHIHKGENDVKDVVKNVVKDVGIRPPNDGHDDRKLLTSFTTARHPRTRTAERLLAGPRRGRRCTPASSCAGHARRQACERLSAGWRVPAEPTMLRLNSHFLGF